LRHHHPNQRHATTRTGNVTTSIMPFHTTHKAKPTVHEKVDSSSTQENNHPQAQHPNYTTVFHFLDEAVHHLAFSKIKPHCFYPRFDVEETEVQYELFGDLPGCKREDIQIHDVHGYGIEIEGLTTRLPHMEGNEPKIPEIVEAKEEEKKTVWPDMAEPGMQAAAEGRAAIPETTTVSNLPEPTEVEPAKAKHHERHESQNGVTKQLPVTYPRTLFHERLVGNFRRTIRFPEPVDTAKVEAELKDGILRIRVPKDLAKIAELEKERKRIEVAWADASLWGI